MRAVVRRWRELSACALWGLVILLAGALVGEGQTAGQELHHAGLVIAFPDGRVETRCISFEEESISGADLLRRSGLPVVVSGFGGLGAGVCLIDDTGCANPGDCFCQCRGGDCNYWSYFTLHDDQWRFQSSGASQREVRDGDVDGWVWGNGGQAPPLTDAGGACTPPTPTAARPPPTRAPSDPPQRDDGGSGQVRPPDDNVSDGDQVAPRRATAAPVDSGVAASTAEPGATLPAPDEVRRNVGTGREVVEGEERTAEAIDESGGAGAPVGLIAFGVVAGVLAVGITGFALRRRFGG